jgi:hypothetical protein
MGWSKLLAWRLKSGPRDALALDREIAQCEPVFFQVRSWVCVAENVSRQSAAGANFFETKSDLIGYNRCRSWLGEMVFGAVC